LQKRSGGRTARLGKGARIPQTTRQFLTALDAIAGYGGSTGAVMVDPTGEANRGVLRLDFDRRLLMQFRGSAIGPPPVPA